jgi:hypothetical protein
MENNFSKKPTTLESNVPPALEERIISYEEDSQISSIISNLSLENFLLVAHKVRTKQLYFKKQVYEPETLIIGDQ